MRLSGGHWEVLTQPITCTATNWPILAPGHKRRWVDTDPADGNNACRGPAEEGLCHNDSNHASPLRRIVVTTRLTPLDEHALSFLDEVRHHPDTIRYLHDDRVFSLEQIKTWFSEEDIHWYLIEDDDVKVGYVRLSHRDLGNKSIKVGADIHPKYRRKGYATAAYRLLIQRLRSEGFHRIWLEVLPDNQAAMTLYGKLGFVEEGRKRDVVFQLKWHKVEGR